MFVDIENQEMNIPQVTEWIIKTRDTNGGIISPEFAMEILSKTNHFGHIKMVLKNIKDKCSDEDKGKYKDFVLTCADGREMSDIALKDLQEMADVCGVRSEFDELDKKEKVFTKKDCQIAIVNSVEEFEAALQTDKLIFADIYTSESVTDIMDKDFSRVRKLRVTSSRPICLMNIQNLPTEMDFSNCDFVDIRNSDFSRVKRFEVKKESNVKMTDCTNIRGKWDLSNVFELNLNGSDFSKAEELKLAQISFTDKTILPAVVDMTCCRDLQIGKKEHYAHVEKCILKRGTGIYYAGDAIFRGYGVNLVYVDDEDKGKKKSSSGFLGRLFGRGIND